MKKLGIAVLSLSLCAANVNASVGGSLPDLSRRLHRSFQAEIVYQLCKVLKAVRVPHGVIAGILVAYLNGLRDRRQALNFAKILQKTGFFYACHVTAVRGRYRSNRSYTYVPYDSRARCNGRCAKHCDRYEEEEYY